MKRLSAKLVKALSRVTSSGEFIAEIDGLRFVAIMSVVFFHSELAFEAFVKVANGVSAPTHPALGLIRCGNIGVPLFFAISGFIIALPFAAHHLDGCPKPSLKRYLLRRVTRLEPPYIVCLTTCLAFALTVKRAEIWGTVRHYLAGLTYTHNFIYSQPNILNNPAWSLEIEVQFYLLAPLLTYVFAIGYPYWRRLIIVVSALVIPWLSSRLHFPLYCLPRFLDWFLVGFLLADVYRTEWRKPPRHTWAWDVIGGGSALALVWLQLVAPHSQARLGAALLFYMGVFRGHFLNWLFTLPFITVIGGMCYTIYLWHSRLLGRMAVHLDGWVMKDHYSLCYFLTALPMIAVVVVLSSVLFYFLEKPFMYRNWPQKVWGFVQQWGKPVPAEPFDDAGAPPRPAPAAGAGGGLGTGKSQTAPQGTLVRIVPQIHRQKG